MTDIFCLFRSVLLLEKPPLGLKHWPCFERSDRVWNGVRTGLAVVFAVIAYASLIPAAFASVIWKVASVTVNLLDGHD